MTLRVLINVNKMVTGLETSKHKHIITLNEDVYKQWGATNEASSKDISEKNTESGDRVLTSGSKTNFDPNDNKDEKGYKEDARAVLAHELSHASDNDNGTKKKGMTKTGVALNEVDAVNVQNKVRVKLNLPKRTDYGGVPIPKELIK